MLPPRVGDTNPSDATVPRPLVGWGGEYTIPLFIVDRSFLCVKILTLNFPKCHPLDAKECICLIRLFSNDYDIFHRQPAAFCTSRRLLVGC